MGVFEIKLNCKRPKELKDTIKMMNSDDYKERFKAEFWQTYIRYEKLDEMLKKHDLGQLNRLISEKEMDLYEKQLKAMTDYLEVLLTRAKINNIDLWEITIERKRIRIILQN